MTAPDLSGSSAEAVASQLDAILACPAAEREAALAAACAAHPALATTLRRRFENLRSLGLLPEDEGPGDGLSIPERLGEFVLKHKIGGGGMGVVFAAEQTSLQRTVALKLIRPELLWFDGAKERFLREAEAVGKLAHPGIVQVFTAGTAQGVPYIAMELVAGHTLADALAKLQGRDPSAVLGTDLVSAPVGSASLAATGARLALAVAEALAHAHARGVLHRDVKPSNVMLADSGRVLLLDFGLAFAESDQRLTKSNAQLGSLAYASPELSSGEFSAVDARSDVFSLGCVLYELVTLRPAFLEATPSRTLRKILHGEPDPPASRNPELPNDLIAILAKMLEKVPARRYATMAACADDLRAFLEHRPVAARLPGPLGRLTRWARRDWKRALLAVTVPVLVVAVAYAFVSRSWAELGRQRAAEVLRSGALERGFFEYAQGSRSAARARFREVLALFPEDDEASAGLALCEGRRPASRPSSLAGSRPVDRFLSAARLMDQGRRGDVASLRQALELLDQAIAHSLVQRPLYHFQRAEAVAQLGEPALIERVAETLLALWPDHPMVAFWCGSLHIATDPERARRWYERAVVLDPTLARAWADLGVLALQAGDVAAAEARLDRALALQPDNAKALLVRAVCELQRERPQAALGYLQKARDADPQLPGVAYHVGVAQIAAGDLEAALAAFAETVVLAPDYVDAWQNLAVLQRRAGALARAAETLRAGLAANPKWADGWLLLVQVERDAGRPKAALPALLRYLELRPDDASARSARQELEALVR